MLNSKDSKIYKHNIEKVMPGLLKRSAIYLKNVDQTHSLLSHYIMTSIRNAEKIQAEKADKKTILNLVYTFFNLIDIEIAKEFATKVKNSEINFNPQIKLGTTKYDKETQTTYIEVQYTETVFDSSIIIHEFMHSKTNPFSGSNLKEMGENRKYQEQLSILIEIAFAKFLIERNIYKQTAQKILYYRLKSALLYIPGELQTKLMGLHFADNNKSQADFEKKFGLHLNKLESDIKKCIPPAIEDYYLGTMSALEHLNSKNEKEFLKEIFSLIKKGDFKKVKKNIPMSCDANRDCKNIENIYKFFTKI